MSPNRPVSLNLNVRGMGQSATLTIRQKCRTLRGEGRHVYDFGLGQSPFPVPNPVVEALRLAAPQKDYLPVEGLPELREAIADFHRTKDHLDIDLAIAIDHMTLAAADQGLGTCRICAFDPDRHHDARQRLEDIVSWDGLSK